MTKTEFDLSQFYSIYPDGIQNHYWNKARNLILYNTIKKFNLQGNKILEIGCGRGVVTSFLRKKQINCYGVELGIVKPIDNTITDYVFYSQDAFTLDYELRNSFTCILLLDVLEHIEFPEQFLANIYTNFPKLTHLVITLPARQELFSNYDVFNGHFRRYSKRTALKTCQSVDGKVLKCDYFFRILYLPALILRLFGVKRSTIIKAPLDKLSILLHGLIARLFFLESILFRFINTGTSVQMVVKKC